jgi:hypothetical protein
MMRLARRMAAGTLADYRNMQFVVGAAQTRAMIGMSSFWKWHTISLMESRSLSLLLFTLI